MASIIKLTMRGFAKELIEMADKHGDLPILIDVHELKGFLPALGYGVIGTEDDTGKKKKVFILSTGIDIQNTMQALLFQEIESREQNEKTKAEGSVTA